MKKKMALISDAWLWRALKYAHQFVGGGYKQLVTCEVLALGVIRNELDRGYNSHLIESVNDYFALKEELFSGAYRVLSGYTGEDAQGYVFTDIDGNIRVKQEVFELLESCQDYRAYDLLQNCKQSAGAKAVPDQQAVELEFASDSIHKVVPYRGCVSSDIYDLLVSPDGSVVAKSGIQALCDLLLSKGVKFAFNTDTPALLPPQQTSFNKLVPVQIIRLLGQAAALSQRLALAEVSLDALCLTACTDPACVGIRVGVREQLKLQIANAANHDIAWLDMAASTSHGFGIFPFFDHILLSR